MSVLLETSLGDIVIDLHTELAPRSCTNFLKLCSKHYYKLNAFFNVEKDFLAQTGDPINTGKGGASIWSQLPSSSKDKLDDPLFRPETSGDQLKHTKKGTVSFACSRKRTKHFDDDGEESEETELVAGSQFFITLKDEIDYLDGRHAPFGIVVEGQEPGGTLDKINEAFTDEQKRPLKDIRIRHVVVLEDPFPDPDGFLPPSRSPSPTPSQIRALRLADDEDLSTDPDANSTEESRRKADTNAAALTLEMVGDLPFAEIRPPENILFVCKLNPVTRSDDLELIFSRFGKILSCEVIKDKKTGDSLQYAFIEFDKKDDAERAYFKMQNVLVDDRRIWVDFSQSVSRLHGDWVRKRNGGREAPKGHYKWGGEGRRDDGQSNGGADSYRPRAGGYQNGERWRDGERYGERPSRRDEGDRRHRNGEDEDRDRAYKRSRRHDEGTESRRDGRTSAISERHSDDRSGKHSIRDDRERTHIDPHKRRSNGRDRGDDDRSRRRHDDDRGSHKRHDEDDRRHRDSGSRRHETGRSDRSGHGDRRDRDRERERDSRRKEYRHRHRDEARR
ncbi:related to Multidomain cyclophilin type peptidyl-prolyl cis-trans isomerase [Ustilago bromivora]|uniref:Peptidyl-prolyl cis-trans isomerase n=1 Tax=Ustilago bromivora TaxID=307758 RepID=A0A1K0H9L5_9BASI|nr:related to Multidomain cyclophilin type peptidyl-prolyl cis-trans isomerase [Ustilago bromivora]SYW74926.1 related to Multidomain cyclophilin type peptidyl-prolyl cis-trans isomerase [Ustilago bromivora]